jgi:hypothetical protein
MKLAHLILIHKNPHQVLRLIKQLLKEDSDIFLHIDKKTNAEPFLNLIQDSRVKFIKERVDVAWGGYSQIKATKAGIKEILMSDTQYNYINFISGQDYPIKKINLFYEFLKTNNGREFIEFHPAEERPLATRRRLYRYHLPDQKFKGKYIIQSIMNMILTKKEFPIKNFEFVWKAQWFTITPDAAKYVISFLKSNPQVETFFKFCWGTDELVFQSILYNSPFKESIYNNNLKYTVWEKDNPSPETFRLKDFDALSKTDKFFARKFDINIDEDILNKIDNAILNI